MSEFTSARHMIAAFVFIIIGPIFWALHLTLIYGFQSAFCAFGTVPWPAITAWVVGASLFTMLLGAIALIWPRRVYRLLTGGQPPADQWSFLAFIMRALTALSLLAMLYAAIGALMLPACGGLR